MGENDYPVLNPKSIRLYKPPINSHKGQNGKLLVIGGSELFHSGIFWSADVASKIVDLVHLTSPANENNQIFRKKLKEKFWNGIVVDWKDVEEYIKEDDAVLIGPGMVRKYDSASNDDFLRVVHRPQEKVSNRSQTGSLSGRPILPSSVSSDIGATDGQFPPKMSSSTLSVWGKKDETEKIINFLLKKYPSKRWVIDGGALQEVDVRLITKSCILTPHQKELAILMKKFSIYPAKQDPASQGNSQFSINLQLDSLTIEDQAKLIAETLGCTILLKGVVDIVSQGNKCVEIKGGNPGMTKGGTGDVLAGLLAALYAKNDSWTAAMMASYVNKKAGESLYKRAGPYFSAEDLVREIPLTLYGIMKRNV